MKKSKTFIRIKRAIRGHTFIRVNILPFYRRIRNYVRYYRTYLSFTKDLSDANTVYYIDPKEIVYHTNYRPEKFQRVEDRVFDMLYHNGKIMPGDWDLSSFKFKDLEIFKAINSRIEQNIDWKNTKYYKTLLSDIQNGYSRFGCTTEQELKLRFEKIDLLIENIKNKGFKEHISRLEKSAPFNNKRIYKDEVTINIGRDGSFLFQNGRHRLSVALTLGIKKIPVCILVRHKNWYFLRKRLLRIATDSEGRLYQPALHPDLKDIPSFHACVDRYKVMREYIKISQGNLLDVGAYLGYFCHKFEDLGFNCSAVEMNHELCILSEKIRDSVGKKFTVVEGNILDPVVFSSLAKQYDIVLFLNILHHFLKEENKYVAMTNWLKQLKAKFIFFEPHLPSENQMKGAYLNYDNYEFIKYIMLNTGKKNCLKVYSANDGRNLYFLS